MKKKIWLVVAVLLVALGGGVLLLRNSSEKPEAETKSNTSSQQTEEVVEPEVTENTTEPEASQVAPGKYVDYSASLLTDESLGTKILFFHAPWCPQCRELEDSIEAGDIPSGVTIIKVDYDSNQSLRSRYGVTIQTSLVRISGSGDLVKKYVAYDEPSLESLKENLL